MFWLITIESRKETKRVHNLKREKSILKIASNPCGLELLIRKASRLKLYATKRDNALSLSSMSYTGLKAIVRT